MQSNLTSAILLYEQGELDDEGVIALFQELVDSGLAWQLQGSYGRTARDLIQAGYVTVKHHCGRTMEPDPELGGRICRHCAALGG